MSLKVFAAWLFAGLMAVTGAQAETLAVVTENWPPYNYEEKGVIKGVSTDIVKAVCREARMDCRIEVLPWARAYQTAMTQKNVMIYTIFRLPGREDSFFWIKMDGLSTRMYLFSPKSRTDIHIDTLEDARQYRTGVTLDTSTHHFLLSMGFVEHENLFPVSYEIFNAFKADPKVRRLDLTTGDRLSLAYWLKTYGFPADYWKEELFLFKEDFYMAFGRASDKDLVSKIQKAFDRISKKGVVKKIIDRHHEILVPKAVNGNDL